jgi:tetratricopeptide (TPR) repeat protein
MFGIVRLFVRLIRLAMGIAHWAEERVKEWWQERQFQIVEGRRHLAARNWGEAEKHLSLALAERRHSKNKRCELLLDLERAQRRQGKLGESEQTLLAAMAIASNRELRARAEDTLLDHQLEQSRYTDAEQSIARILEAEKAQSRPDGARILTCYQKLGALRLKTGREDEALEAFRWGAEQAERIYGAAHTKTAECLGQLGALQRGKGNHLEAQRCLRRALEIHREAAGLDSHEATDGLYQLASSLEESGDLDGAAGEFERLLLLRSRQVGVNPLENAQTQVRLAGLYLKGRRTGPAKELLNSAISVLERNGGLPLAQALETLASAEEQAGRRDEARHWREVASNFAAGTR